MEPNNLRLAAIHPRKGTKYSPNLHRFLSAREHPILARYARVYRDAKGTLWLGYFFEDDQFTGTRLMQVLSQGRKAFVGAWGRQLGPLAELRDFWRHYLVDGRCALDPEHQVLFTGDETRWAGDESQRTCLWCGKAHQRREHWIERVKRDRWVTEEGPCPV